MCYTVLSVENVVNTTVYGNGLVQGRVQQLTGLIGLSIGPAYVRPVSCWTAFIVIQLNKMAAIASKRYTT